MLKFRVDRRIMLYNVVLTLMSVGESVECNLNQMKANEQYFVVVLFIMLYKVVLTLKSARVRSFK